MPDAMYFCVLRASQVALLADCQSLLAVICVVVGSVAGRVEVMCWLRNIIMLLGCRCHINK